MHVTQYTVFEKCFTSAQPKMKRENTVNLQLIMCILCQSLSKYFLDSKCLWHDVLWLHVSQTAWNLPACYTRMANFHFQLTIINLVSVFRLTIINLVSVYLTIPEFKNLYSAPKLLFRVLSQTGRIWEKYKTYKKSQGLFGTYI